MLKRRLIQLAAWPMAATKFGKNAIWLLGLALAACTDPALVSTTCYQSRGYCVSPDGSITDLNGKPIVANANNTAGNTANANSPINFPVVLETPPVCSVELCPVTVGVDSDGDCIPDSKERGIANQSTDPHNPDTDGDQVRDGCEDKNQNGVRDPGEMNPLVVDSDADLIPDGTEDTNHNGIRDPSETSPILADTDFDGIPDGSEDLNHDGVVAVGRFRTPGCFNAAGNTADVPGETDPRIIDSDGDGIPDGAEDKNHNGVFDPNLSLHETVAFATGAASDSDCDGLADGIEDLNHNGNIDRGETDPRNVDSDGDLLADGTEDTNHNGHWDFPQETSPLLTDSDGDGIFDGVEDKNHNGLVDNWQDVDHNGCYNPFAGDIPGESDPRKADTDADGLRDSNEDLNQDGNCNVALLPNPLNPSKQILTFSETCAFTADTDCDALPDGFEDKNYNGVVDTGETDPRRQDTDYDQLTDGCPVGATLCEDKNNNGVVDVGETDPTLADTDGDYLSDYCEVTWSGPQPPPIGTNPLSDDTDNDGYADGDEDANHNCQLDPGETDPRVANGAPAATTTCVAGGNTVNPLSCLPEYEVCAPDNLANLGYAATSRPTQDYRLALEVEKAVTAACKSTSDCPTGQSCINQSCILLGPYSVQGYGADLDGGGFDANDPNDVLHGFFFESPPGVVTDAATGTLLNRDIYGYVYSGESTSALDAVLDASFSAISAQLVAAFPGATVLQAANLPARSAYDSLAPDPANNLPGYAINFGQRQVSIALSNPQTALQLRNTLLAHEFSQAMPQYNSPAPVPPTIDPVYGPIGTCVVGANNCYSAFTLYLGGVQRLQQVGPTGKPVVITTVALTPNNANPTIATSPFNRFYADRVTRLSDLTGGASLGRFASITGKSCDGLPQKLAQADMLWVVDDSLSMQQIISRVQLAAADAETVLQSNSGILDFRVAMTTTNPSPAARTQCPSYCSDTCNNANVSISDLCGSSCADQTLGCIKACPASCVYNTAPNTCNAEYLDCRCTTCSGSDPNVSGSPPDQCSIDGTVSDTDASQRMASSPNCTAPGYFANAVAQDAQRFSLPGGGGTFYYEDTHYLDCKATSALGQDNFLNQCNLYVNNTSGVLQFYGASSPYPNVKLNDAGFFGSHADAVACATGSLDLYYDTTQNNYTPGQDSGHPACQRLTPTSSCQDGPTILSSQMCNLIREMGGVDVTHMATSARRHSAPEMGTRSARRLLTAAMSLAYPSDMSDPNSPNFNGVARQYVRRNCTVATCPTALPGACHPLPSDPQYSPLCTTIPTATVILSDEEDFWFKDDCMDSATDADRQQLPENCLYNNGGACSAAYCSQVLAASGTNGTTNPRGYGPDQAAFYNDGSDAASNGYFTLQWPNSLANLNNPNAASFAPECSPHNPSTSCIGDPCPYVNQSTCQDQNHRMCQWATSIDNAPVTPQCINHCAVYSFNSGTALDQTDAAAQQAACTQDATCMWNASLVQYNNQSQQVYGSSVYNYPGACVPNPNSYPNDCQPCKRFMRNQMTLQGGDTGLIQGTQAPLAGFQDANGAVYGIVRGKGMPGWGSYGTSANTSGNDACQGGPVTWGRGDGQAYRDLAAATLGRIQDVCATDYTEFMQLLTGDLATLSAPYPLSSSPVPATLQVGLARLVSGTWTYIAVPRSTTQGFLYDATRNSIGFKSDPVDGLCAAGAGCAANGVIEPSEVAFAAALPTVPLSGDVIYVSYRPWIIANQCPLGETEERVVCTQLPASFSCNTNPDCPTGYDCNAGTCNLACQPHQLINVCVNEPTCNACQTYDATTKTCVQANACCASTEGQACNPAVVGTNQCPVGQGCNESCVCGQLPGCNVTFNSDGTVSNGPGAVACCNGFAANANTCTTHKSSTTCNQDANCVWPGACLLGSTGQPGVPCTGLDENYCQKNSSCTWQSGGAGSVCEYRYQLCCPEAGAISYHTDPALGVTTVFCSPSACDCAPCLSAGLLCDPDAPVPTSNSNSCACYANSP